MKAGEMKAETPAAGKSLDQRPGEAPLQPLYGYRKYWAHRLTPAPVLPARNGVRARIEPRLGAQR